MKLLLDTCVLAESSRPRPNQKVVDFININANHTLFVSVLSVGEITKGIHLLPASQRKNDLQQWLLLLEHSYQDHILPIDTQVSKIWGEITAQAQSNGKIIPSTDGLIAATAISHGLHLATRNIKDFQYTPVLLINPWE
jgi:predicted nucleic acid-binding protein